MKRDKRKMYKRIWLETDELENKTRDRMGSFFTDI